MTRNASKLYSALTAAVLFFAAATVQAQINLSASIEMSNESKGFTKAFGWNEDLFVDVTLENSGDEEAHLLKYNAPFHGIHRQVFDVRRDGEKVDYLGVIAEFGPPTAESYISLAPGDSISERIEISKYFDMSEPGNYSIAFSSMFQKVLGRTAESDVLLKEVTSEPTHIYYAGRVFDPYSALDPEDPARPENLNGMTKSSNTFVGCGSTKTQKLTNARIKAQNMTSHINGVLDGHNGSGGNTYQNFFGTNNATRHATVEANYQAAHDALDTEDLTFICRASNTGSCNLTTQGGVTSGVTAYVSKSNPWVINICQFYFDIFDTKEKRGAVIVHELMHFNQVAGASDYAYGKDDCKDLADDDPDTAVKNADSYEIYLKEKN